MACRVAACVGSVEVPELVTTLLLRCSSGGAVCDFVLVVLSCRCNTVHVADPRLGLSRFCCVTIR